jgi:hypothetical protein
MDTTISVTLPASQIDVHPGAPELLGAGPGQVPQLVHVGRRDDDNLFALVTRLFQRAFCTAM